MSAIIDDDLVEAVARGLCRCVSCEDTDMGCGSLGSHNVPSCRDMARAALAVAVPIIVERCAATVAASVLDDEDDADPSAFARGLRTGVNISAGVIRSLTKEGSK